MEKSDCTTFCLVYRGVCISNNSDVFRMDLRETFSANLRRIRNERGISQDDLAYDANMSRSYLSQLESGTYFVSIKIIGRLADALSVEPAEFLRMLDKSRVKKRP